MNKTPIKRAIASFPPPFKRIIGHSIIRIRENKGNRLITPNLLTFFVTNRCNLRCKHCFYWKEINSQTDELNIDEISNVASALKEKADLALTGGEPFVRNDLFDICKVFKQRNKADTFMFVTNGTYTSKIISVSKRILHELKPVHLSIQISLDGTSKVHDKIRGVAGAHDRAMETISQLNELRKSFSNLSISSLFVIQKANIDNMDLFYQEIGDIPIEKRIAFARGAEASSSGINKKLLSGFRPQNENKTYLDLNDMNSVIEKLHSDSFKPLFYKKEIAKIEFILDILTKGKTRNKDFFCYAGRSEAILYPNGDVAVCEFTKPFANVKDYDYDFAKLWHSDEANLQRHITKKCVCSHDCVVSYNMARNPEFFMENW